MSDQSSNPILDAALQYAGRGWRVIPLHGIVNGVCTCKARAACPTPGKHPSIKTGRAFAGASTDPKLILDWFRRANRNVGIATGHGLLVVDVDGPEGLATLRGIADRLPRTLLAQSGRPDGGMHLWFACDSPCPTNSGGGLDCRGDGGLVVVPPSRHVSGQSYKWLNSYPLAPVPPALLAFLSQRKGGRRQRAPNNLPPYLQGSKRGRIAELATAGMHDQPSDADLASLAETIPNTDNGWDEWNRIGMAFFAATAGSDDGLAAFLDWSSKSDKYDEQTTLSRWQAYANSPPTELSLGTLIYEAREAQPGFNLPSRAQCSGTGDDTTAGTGGQTPNAAYASNRVFDGTRPLPPDRAAKLRANYQDTHPFAGGPPHHADPPTTLQILNDFNSRYCVVKIGGKAIVMHWKPSNWNPTLNEPVFMTFKSFTEFYCNRYVVGGDGKDKPLGSYWLKWNLRKTYYALDLVPKGDCPKMTLNLWRGFAVEPQPGAWTGFKKHIRDVVAAGDVVAADYILRWCAWAVQNPDKPAEVALVLRGGKGSGKGTFASTIQALFGCHGLQISSSKHLTGHFNAILRDCLLLFADEAYWAGDKAGESSLKSLLTEKTLMIEHKGLDPLPWRNRLHVIMAANADWAVPASHDERRFAVFDVVDTRAQDFAYFGALRAELEAGGLAGMLHDLLAYDLGDWHPRDVVQTEALQGQKELSLGSAETWWLSEVLEPLQEPEGKNTDGFYKLITLYEDAKRHAPYWKTSTKIFGKFLKRAGAINIHNEKGNFWKLPNLKEARKIWEKLNRGWKWPV